MSRNCECCSANYATGKSYGDSWSEISNTNVETKGLCEFCNQSNHFYLQAKMPKCRLEHERT